MHRNLLTSTLYVNRQSDFDFTKAKGTPGGFALSEFSAVDGKAKNSLVTASKLYGAVNAALRDRGERKILSKLKV